METSEAIGIVGMGYVGLPLAMQFCRVGARVVGFDVDADKVKMLNEGSSYILHIDGASIREQRESGRFEATTDFVRTGECGAVIICVPTPLGEGRTPDLSYVLATGRSLAPHLRKGMLVVLESTTYPGTTDTDLRQVLEEGSGMQAGRDFHLAFSPEREDPGNPDSKVRDIPKVVGGLTPACLEQAMKLYGQAIRTLVPVADCRVAEAVKLTENIFRAVNIAMVNELKVVYEAMGIDVWDVIAAAKTKPFGFMPFYPGPGLGGHCIPIDPFYLSWKAKQHGQETRFIELAGEVNRAMPKRVVEKVTGVLNLAGVPLAGARVLLIGIAYKANVDDDRESPGYVLWELLEENGIRVAYHDPHVPVIRPSREHSELAGQRSLALTVEVLAEQDLVLVATHHEAVDWQLIAKHAVRVVDTRNALATEMAGMKHYVKA